MNRIAVRFASASSEGSVADCVVSSAVPRRRRRAKPLACAVMVCAVVLSVSVVASAQDGLLGEYFDDTSLIQLADTRVDPQVDFLNWQGAPPGTIVIQDDEFSERWTGYVRIDTTGDWTISTNSNDGVRLWVAGQLLIDNWSMHPSTLDSATVTLGVGWHALKLEHFQLGGQMAMQLYFEGPGRPFAIIPSNQLSVMAGGNLPPTVSAGPDLIVIAPENSIDLVSTASDADGTIDDILWSQLSGPPSTLTDASAAILELEDMDLPGGYVYQVTVTDDGGAQASDTVAVMVVDCDATSPTPKGTLRRWHRMALDFVGPMIDESDVPNPFRDYRLTVRFTHASTGAIYDIPGFFNADGRADDTSVTGGKQWRVWFTPDQPGNWHYSVSFRSGPDVAVSLDPLAGTPTDFDGTTGCFSVLPTDPMAPGFRVEGRIAYTGEHFLRHLGTGRPYLKGGANSPENLLAYIDFDQTPNGSHAYTPHLLHWQPTDPTWAGGFGKAIIGAMNYLSARGMNAVYFLTFNVGGDGNDVWMWTSSSERERFDVSKLAQWEVVFNHMDDLGLAMHVITQEQENDTGSSALDNGQLGLERKLYYRELVARFGHHLGVVWNLGEENTNSSGQLQAFYDYITALDAYDHPVVVHSFPGQQNSVYGPLLDIDRLEGASLQSLTPDVVHAQTLLWRQESADHGRPWFVSSDETGPSSVGVAPDAIDPTHDEPRKEILWGNLMAGGAGVEWYFGYGYPNDDLDCEDWRSRDIMWQQTGHALSFFKANLPYPEMQPSDGLVSNRSAWCLASEDDIYVVYLPFGGTTQLDLGTSTRTFDISWFDPRNGGPLQQGTVTKITGPGPSFIGTPPLALPGDDWVALIEGKGNVPPVVGTVRAQPDPFPGNADLAVLISATDPDGPDDIVAVRAMLISPDLTQEYIVLCDELAPGAYGFVQADVPPLTPGIWYLVGAVYDTQGHRHYKVETFEAL